MKHNLRKFSALEAWDVIRNLWDHETISPLKSAYKQIFSVVLNSELRIPSKVDDFNFFSHSMNMVKARNDVSETRPMSWATKEGNNYTTETITKNSQGEWITSYSAEGRPEKIINYIEQLSKEIDSYNSKLAHSNPGNVRDAANKIQELMDLGDDVWGTADRSCDLTGRSSIVNLYIDNPKYEAFIAPNLTVQSTFLVNRENGEITLLKNYEGGILDTYFVTEAGSLRQDGMDKNRDYDDGTDSNKLSRAWTVSNVQDITEAGQDYLREFLSHHLSDEALDKNPDLGRSTKIVTLTGHRMRAERELDSEYVGGG